MRHSSFTPRDNSGAAALVWTLLALTPLIAVLLGLLWVNGPAVVGLVALSIAIPAATLTRGSLGYLAVAAVAGGALIGGMFAPYSLDGPLAAILACSVLIAWLGFDED